MSGRLVDINQGHVDLISGIIKKIAPDVSVSFKTKTAPSEDNHMQLGCYDVRCVIVSSGYLREVTHTFSCNPWYDDFKAPFVNAIRTTVRDAFASAFNPPKRIISQVEFLLLYLDDGPVMIWDETLSGGGGAVGTKDRAVIHPTYDREFA